MRNRRVKMKNASLKRKLQTVFATVLPAVMITVSSMGVYAATAWSKTTSMPTEGDYYLENDVNVSGSWTVTGDQKLDLNGKTVSANDVYVANGKNLSIYDSNGGGTVKTAVGGTGAIYGSSTGTVDIYGGTITGGSSRLVNGTTANIHGGEIQYSTLESGEKVTVDGGTFVSDPTKYLAAGATVTNVGGKYVVNAAAPAAEPQVEADSHVHSYEWVSVKGASDSEDEVMQYRCSCGAVKEEMKVANSAFNKFNQDIANQISKAASGSTVRVEMGSFTAIHQMIFDAMRQRTDVSVDFIFRNEGHMYSLSVPGGANLSTLPGGAAYTNTESCGCEGIYYVAQQTKTVPAPLN